MDAAIVKRNEMRKNILFSSSMKNLSECIDDNASGLSLNEYVTWDFGVVV